MNRAYEAAGAVSQNTEESVQSAQELKQLRDSTLIALSRIEPALKEAIHQDPGNYPEDADEGNDGDIPQGVEHIDLDEIREAEGDARPCHVSYGSESTPENERQQIQADKMDITAA